MKYLKIYVLLVVLTLGCNEKNMKERVKEIPVPVASKEAKELTIHGDTRIDNYYWMRLSDEQKNAEEPDEHTKKVLNYLKEENAYLDKVLEPVKSFQDSLYDEIVGRIKQQDESVPYFKNGYWYYTRYEEGQEYPVYCRKKDNLDAPEEIMLDVNKMAEGYDFFQIGGLSVSPDNHLLAYSVDTISRRIYTIKVKDLNTGEDLPDIIENTTGSIAWANDNKTMFYTQKNKVTLLSEKIFRHTLGAQNDVLVYQEKDPAFYIGVYREKSGKYIIIWNSSTLVSDYHILNADTPEGEFKQFTPREKDMLYDIHHFKDKFYVLTNLDATNFRLMGTPTGATSKDNWKEVIPHREDVLIESIELFDNYLVVDERKEGLTNLRVINQSDRSEYYIDFGEPAYMAYISVNPEYNTPWLRFGYSSLTTPSSIFDYNMDTKEKELKKQEEVVGGHDPSDYVTERLFATARDGVKVPISLVYKKGFNKDGKAPLLLYGYGSYGSTIDASFSSVRLSLLDRGFVYAIAHIRGGQMLGRQWYEDGKLLKKINTFNDFIDCGKYLVESNYTSKEHLYAMGGSAGGLLMGAVVNMEPELFNGVVAAVPFVDVTTTMLDASIPLTTNEYDEWGNPEQKEYYEYIMKYSPYDNIKAQAYPNMLVTTGLFDSQVQYWEPAKWVAKLREYKTDDNVLIMHTNMETGHSGASGRFQRYKEYALDYAFIFFLEGIAK